MNFLCKLEIHSWTIWKDFNIYYINTGEHELGQRKRCKKCNKVIERIGK